MSRTCIEFLELTILCKRARTTFSHGDKVIATVKKYYKKADVEIVPLNIG